MRRAARSAVVVVCALLGSALPSLAAGTAELLADINQNPSFSSSYGVGELLVLGDRLVFPAYEPSSGKELWVSDGTFHGTRLLVDAAPGSESTRFRWLGTVRRTAVFLVDVGFGSGSGPWHLWRSDGTAEGTFPIYEEEGLDGCSFPLDPQAVTAGNRLYFRASLGRCGLWTSDGTAAGTHRIEDEDLEESVQEIVAMGNRPFFSTRTGLWSSDEDNAFRIRGFPGFSGQDGPRRLTVAGSRVLFLVEAEEGEGEELWISDGTQEGTRALTRFFEPEPFGESPLLTVIGGTIYFTADDGTGTDLWQSDGSGATPRRVTDFIETRPFEERFGADQIARLGNRLIFAAREEGNDFWGKVWVSEGTPASTRPLEGCPGGCPRRALGAPMLPLGNRIVFEGTGQTSQRRELWATDGTPAGTRRLADVAVSRSPVPVLGKLYFIGAPDAGYGLWRTDGTPAGTVQVADLGLGAFNSFGTPLLFTPVVLGGRFFFRANAGEQEPQLWVSEGTASGTRPVTSVRDSPSSFPRNFTPFGAGALFSAGDGDWDERTLWRTDGTAAGTIALPAVQSVLSITDTVGGTAFVLTGRDRFSGPFQIWRTDGTGVGTFRIDPPGLETLGILTLFRNKALFAIHEENQPITLWESDGTLAGTRAVLALPAEIESVRSPRAFGSRLYFAAYVGFDQLWVSDGSLAETRSLTPEFSIDFSGLPLMALVGQTVYFADSGMLWKTDGTAAGTSQVPFPSGSGLQPRDLTEFHGALYFIASTPASPTQRGLWRTDGTPAGTFLVKPVGRPARDSPVGDPVVQMVRLGDRLFFFADDGEHGAELWVSDGTAAGTVLVRDVLPGEGSALPTLSFGTLVAAGGKIYFPATDGTSGFELWESDGTAVGTRRVQDIATGALSSHPTEIVAAGNRLFFAADDGVHGEEPWVLPLDGGGCVPSVTALCLGGRFRVEADWHDFQGNRGRGTAVSLTADTGTFWFFDAANVEVILKVLDGRGLNGHHWVFYGALSSVEYMLTVTDTQTGAVRRYFNPSGALGSVADTEAFGPNGAKLAGHVSEGPAPRRGDPLTVTRTAPDLAAGSCAPTAQRLCLNGGRFAVEARWRRSNGASGTARAVPLPGGDTGYFWFFDASNVEVVLKVLDGRPVNGKFWIFYGALSDVEYTVTVTDTETGAVKTYTNPSGRLASVADTGAF